MYIHPRVCVSSCHMAKNVVVNHSSLTARGLKLVIKRSLNFLSVQNTREWSRQKNQLLTVFINGRGMISMSLVLLVVCVLDIWGGSTMTRARGKKSFVYFSTTFDTVLDTPSLCLHFLYIYVYIYIYIYIYMKRVSRGCSKRLRIKVKYVKCVNTLKKLKKSSLLHLHEGIKWKAVWLDNGEDKLQR